MNYFVSASKTGENTVNILNCYFSKWIYTLAPQTKYLHKCKETKHTDQSILQVFLVSLKRNDSRILKWRSCKIFFFQCICYVCNFLWQMFFIPSWKLEEVIFFKGLLVLWGVFRPLCRCFLWNKCYERSPCFILSPQ